MNRILLIFCACIALACFAPLTPKAIAFSASHTAVMPIASPVLPVASAGPQGPQPSNVWPMLGLSAIIAAGGLALMRKIASTLS